MIFAAKKNRHTYSYSGTDISERKLRLFSRNKRLKA